MYRRILVLALVGLLGATPVAAKRLEEQLVDQLHAQGFSEVEVSRTLLGRIRLVAESPSRWREIIINPRTGEILRDYSEILNGDEDTGVWLLDTGSTATSGSNSGSGSSGSNSGSNSGSGSSGSNSGSGSSGSNSGSGSSGSNSGSGSSGSNSGSGSSGGHGSDDSGSDD